MITGVKVLKRNMISNAIGIIVPALAWLLVVPIILHNLGERGYGVYTIAISLAGVLGFLDLGLASAATKYIAEVNVRGNAEKLEKIISNNILLYIAIGGGITVLCFISAPFLASSLFHSVDISRTEPVLIIKLIGIIFSLTLLRNALSSVPMGFQRYDIYNTIQVSYAIALALVQGVIAVKGGKVIALLMGNIGVMALSLVGFAIAIHHLAPKVCLFRLPDSSVMRILFAFGTYMMLINITTSVLFNIDKVIIGQVLGPESVAYYANPNQITLKIHNGLAVFVSFIFPLASEAYSVGDMAILKKIYLQGMRLILLFDGAIMVFLGVFARQILAIWIDPDYATAASPILLFTALGYFAYALSIIPYHLLIGIGHPKEMALLNMLIALIVIVCLFVGVTSFGLIGGSFGAMLGMSTTVVLPWYVQRRLDIAWNTILKDSYGRTALCCISGIVVGTILPDYLWIKLLFYISFLVALLLFGNTKREDWNVIQNVYRRVIIHSAMQTKPKKSTQ